MKTIARALVVVVAVEHILFLILETFLWDQPFVEDIVKGLGFTPHLDEVTKVARNQGVYNAFLAAGLIWGLLDSRAGFRIQLFFLTCVIVAGICGFITIKPKFLWIQTLPAVIALAFVCIAGREKEEPSVAAP